MIHEIDITSKLYSVLVLWLFCLVIFLMSVCVCESPARKMEKNWFVLLFLLLGLLLATFAIAVSPLLFVLCSVDCLLTVQKKIHFVNAFGYFFFRLLVLLLTHNIKIKNNGDVPFASNGNIASLYVLYNSLCCWLEFLMRIYTNNKILC